MRTKKLSLLVSIISLLQPGTTGAGNCNSSQEPPTYEQAMGLAVKKKWYTTLIQRNGENRIKAQAPSCESGMEEEKKTNTTEGRARKNSRQNQSGNVQEIQQPPVDYRILTFVPDEDADTGFYTQRGSAMFNWRSIEQEKQDHRRQCRKVGCFRCREIHKESVARKAAASDYSVR